MRMWLFGDQESAPGRSDAHGKRVSEKAFLNTFLKTLHKILLSSKPHEYVKLNAASTIQKAKNRALATVVITSYERMMKYAHRSDGQSYSTMQHRVIWNEQSSYFNARHGYS
ncbi:hypothetical protein Tsp_12567 [Trichinella spiralis]|uniref:hypothetical protein n=1 Tax=Trichinella spiralis TaxID=6334 RepID=UPI0001EFE5B5|nr:hypothetical protein Tsp_12567 [Trichinella spiralis]